MVATLAGSGRARLMTMAVTAAAAAAVLAGCGSSSGGSGSASQVTITYLTHWAPPQVNILKQAATAFHKANPDTTVKFETVPFANLLTTLDTQGPSGSPTITNIYDLWLPQLVQSGLAAAAPADVASDVKANWPANLAADVTKSGAVRGIPNEVDLYALNYNKALFSAAGISAPPTNWTQLLADAKKLTNKAKGVQGFGVITSWNSGVVHPWLSLVDSNGGKLLNGTTPDLTSPDVEAATKLYSELVSSGATVPSMSSANADTTGPYLDNFAAGKTGMIIMANWWESDLESAMGSRFSDVGVAPIPVGPDGTTASSVSYSWTTVVNAHATSSQQAAAWKFLQYVTGPTSGKNGSSAMGDALISMGILPSRTSDDTAHAAQLSSPYLKEYVSLLPHATPFPAVLGGEQMTDTLQTDIESVIFGKSSPTSAMSTAQSQVASILKSASAGG
jgi:multiple sugar transport system substrate-binding protein